MKEKRKISMFKLAIDPKTIAGVIISITGMYWAFKDFDFFAFKESIQKIDLIYLVLASLFSRDKLLYALNTPRSSSTETVDLE